MKVFSAFLLLSIGFVSCTVQRGARSTHFLDSLWNSPVFAHHHTGLVVYDPTQQQTLVTHNADRYFVPASNTKLFTFFAGLKILGDSVEALRYTIRNDSLIFTGTGDPSLLNPYLPESGVLSFLQSRPEKLVFHPGNVQQKILGSGWAWDDYNDSYQSELSSLPLYGNLARFSSKTGVSLTRTPRRFSVSTDTLARPVYMQRSLTENTFHSTGRLLTPAYAQEVPYRTSGALTSELLSDTLHRPVSLLPEYRGTFSSTLHSIRTDSLYQYMLQESDNFMAEQILLMICSRQQLPLKSSIAIDTVLNRYLRDLPDRPKWVDGSGLSRYNLFTPRSLVSLLEKTYRIVPQQRLFSLLAIGGKAGSLKRSYVPADAKPFIFAKTGSFSGCYNLSGYLIARSGRVLIFSFMNNHFTRPLSEIRKGVEQALLAIRDHY